MLPRSRDRAGRVAEGPVVPLEPKRWSPAPADAPVVSGGQFGWEMEVLRC
jgi:hypothetical protein